MAAVLSSYHMFYSKNPLFLHILLIFLKNTPVLFCVCNTFYYFSANLKGGFDVFHLPAWPCFL